VTSIMLSRINDGRDEVFSPLAAEETADHAIGVNYPRIKRAGHA